MKTHHGMRPQDVLILLKILAKGGQPWLNKDLAAELFMSPSEISESLNRSRVAGLIDGEKKEVFILAFTDFLLFGLRYVYPARPGALVRGIPTAHSAPVMATFFTAEEKYVWPDAEGEDRGQTIEPLYPSVPKAVKIDPRLYDLLALADVMRVGRTREIKEAARLIQEMAKDYTHGA